VAQFPQHTKSLVTKLGQLEKQRAPIPWEWGWETDWTRERERKAAWPKALCMGYWPVAKACGALVPHGTHECCSSLS